MPTKFNLLGHEEKLTRDVSSRLANKEENRKIALNFGKEYFDGPRQQGYGGYVYDGRWIKVANRLVSRYGLVSGNKILDVGCAKGFLLHDLTQACPGINVRGIDVSSYAKENSCDTVRELIDLGSCVKLPYPDDYFDATVAINSIHNVNYDNCRRALCELIRVTRHKAKIFVQVDAYNNDTELQLFKDWVLTAKTYMKPSQWLSLFEEVGYEGDYFWTVIGFESDS